jgi:hypothetical protein
VVLCGLGSSSQPALVGRVAGHACQAMHQLHQLST